MSDQSDSGSGDSDGNSGSEDGGSDDEGIVFTTSNLPEPEKHEIRANASPDDDESSDEADDSSD